MTGPGDAKRIRTAKAASQGTPGRKLRELHRAAYLKNVRARERGPSSLQDTVLVPGTGGRMRVQPSCPGAAVENVVQIYERPPHITTKMVVSVSGNCDRFTVT